MTDVAFPLPSPRSSAGPRPPSGLPELRAGAHVFPEDGACLMEYVSVLVGARFTDHPRCTDPTLATVARLVNDACTDTGRRQLAAFAPVLAETAPGDPRRAAAIVRAAVRTACRAAGDTSLGRQLGHAEHRFERVAGTGVRAAVARHLDPLYRQGRGRVVLEESVDALRELPDPQRDAALIATLAAALAAAAPPPRPHAAARSGQQGPPATSVGAAPEPVWR